MALRTAHRPQNRIADRSTSSVDCSEMPDNVKTETVTCAQFLDLMLSRRNLARVDVPGSYGLLDTVAAMHYVVSMVEFDTWRDTGADG